jgi:hypothetical protein
MSATLLIRGTGVWLVIMAAAVINGVIRDEWLNPLLGDSFALPLSGVMLSLLIFIITYFSVTLIGLSTTLTCLVIGLFWVILTLSFEYLFGHFVLGMPWYEISRVFDVTRGNLFVLALFAAALSPWIAARLRGMIG